MQTVSKNFIHKRGDTFNFTFTYLSDGVPVDLSACDRGLMQLRSNELSDPAVTLSGDSIFLGSLNFGSVGITQNIEAAAGQYCYDLQLGNSIGYTITLLSGRFTITEDYARP